MSFPNQTTHLIAQFRASYLTLTDNDEYAKRIIKPLILEDERENEEINGRVLAQLGDQLLHSPPIAFHSSVKKGLNDDDQPSSYHHALMSHKKPNQLHNKKRRSSKRLRPKTIKEESSRSVSNNSTITPPSNEITEQRKTSASSLDTIQNNQSSSHFKFRISPPSQSSLKSPEPIEDNSDGSSKQSNKFGLSYTKTIRGDNKNKKTNSIVKFFQPQQKAKYNNSDSDSDFDSDGSIKTQQDFMTNPQALELIKEENVNPPLDYHSDDGESLPSINDNADVLTIDSDFDVPVSETGNVVKTANNNTIEGGPLIRKKFRLSLNNNKNNRIEEIENDDHDESTVENIEQSSKNDGGENNEDSDFEEYSDEDVDEYDDEDDDDYDDDDDTSSTDSAFTDIETDSLIDSSSMLDSYNGVVDNYSFENPTDTTVKTLDPSVFLTGEIAKNNKLTPLPKEFKESLVSFEERQKKFNSILENEATPSKEQNKRSAFEKEETVELKISGVPFGNSSENPSKYKFRALISGSDDKTNKPHTLLHGTLPDSLASTSIKYRKPLAPTDLVSQLDTQLLELIPADNSHLRVSQQDSLGQDSMLSSGITPSNSLSVPGITPPMKKVMEENSDHIQVDSGKVNPSRFSSNTRTNTNTAESIKRQLKSNKYLEDIITGGDSQIPKSLNDIYMRWKVWRKKPTLLNRIEKSLIIDGDYIHLTPTEDTTWKKNPVDNPFSSSNQTGHGGNTHGHHHHYLHHYNYSNYYNKLMMKTSSFHITQITKLKQYKNSKNPNHFKIVIKKEVENEANVKDNAIKKKYDLEAVSAAECEDIINKIRHHQIDLSLTIPRHELFPELESSQLQTQQAVVKEEPAKWYQEEEISKDTA
ncbi:hypothetical protein QCA50_015853 [Cerrena zonata]|uniref:SIN1-type PH domain-containing protein n=1 Tax=Cerrena zonata TaxID=2478898 RepID=A0AAW0FUL2_9APHY